MLFRRRSDVAWVEPGLVILGSRKVFPQQRPGVTDVWMAFNMTSPLRMEESLPHATCYLLCDDKCAMPPSTLVRNALFHALWERLEAIVALLQLCTLKAGRSFIEKMPDPVRSCAPYRTGTFHCETAALRRVARSPMRLCSGTSIGFLV